MRRIILSDVGDGLCSVISSPFGINIQIDWGSQNRRQSIDGWRRSINVSSHPHLSPDIFVLSHFHHDHFNGLLYAAENMPEIRNALNIKEVYFPGQPKFFDSRELYFAFLTVARYTIGDNSGHMGIDLVGAVDRLSRFRPTSKELFQDDVFNAGVMQFRCLWPPREYRDNNFTKAVGKALSAFNKALKENEILRAIHRTVVEEDTFSNLDKENERVSNDEWKFYEGGNFVSNESNNLLTKDVSFSEYESSSNKTSFKEANKLLRGVANRLCVVLLQDDDFLFWGDLEPREIRIVVNNLVSEGYNNFKVMIAPHHGTHWHNDMRQLRTKVMLVPNGERLHSKFKSELKQISQRTISTHMNGNIYEIY